MTIPFEPRLIDRHFADFIARHSGAMEHDALRLVVARLSAAVGEGHTCLDLHECAGLAFEWEGCLTELPSFRELYRHLKSLPTVASAGERKPLVLDDAGRLYLYRYWRYEQELARMVLDMAADDGVVVDEGLLGEGLQRLFAENRDDDGEDFQKIAASLVVHKRFAVICGAPGTGKTSTVVKILALLQEQAQAQAQGRPLRIALAAPTGKAAARLKHSLTLLQERLATSDAIKSVIPQEVTTLHRLLGSVTGSVRFRHSALNQLPFDMVVLDEASMVSLPLMAKLVTALKPAARLLLLGDRDQLASVEAGAVLGDICSSADASASSLLAGSLVELQKNYRFAADSTIAALSRAVNLGQSSSALALFGEERDAGVVLCPLPSPDKLKQSLSRVVIEGYRSCFEALTPGEALERFERFRILCALREGVYGVTGINALVETILHAEGVLDPALRWYRGRPLLVTANDYPMQLFNGDIGMVFPDTAQGGATRVFFPASDGGLRAVAPERLVQHETAFAMTVHKSQGSEFDRVLLILPPRDSDLLSRELLYTAITRARHRVEIWGSEGGFSAAVKRKTQRASGLQDALTVGVSSRP